MVAKEKKIKVLTIVGKMKCKTGVMIGGYAGSKRIGGVDNPIIRDPLTEYPYIPGSSMRGKLRSLYEMAHGLYEEDGSPHKFKEECAKNNCTVCRVFGSIEGKKRGENGGDKKILKTTRLIVRDSFLDEESKKILDDYREKTGLNYTEIKMENYINRLTSQANPRTFERIPAGVSFDVEMVLKVYEEDDEKELLDVLRECIRLLEKDYIGAAGSRGYGRVAFEELEVIDENGNRKPLFS